MKLGVILAVLIASIGCGGTNDERSLPATTEPAAATTPAASAAETETKERDDYLSKISLTKINARRTVGTLEELVGLVDGQVKNAGDRAVEKLEITMFFLNRAGEQIREETTDVLSAPLKPEETRKFAVAVRLIPDDWSGKVEAKVSRLQLAPR